MTATAVDELAALDWKTGAPCQGTGHHDVHVPRGDARWVQDGVCPRCGMHATPVRLCEGGRLYRLLCDQVRCSASTGGCGQASPTDLWGFVFTRIGGDR